MIRVTPDMIERAEHDAEQAAYTLQQVRLGGIQINALGVDRAEYIGRLATIAREHAERVTMLRLTADEQAAHLAGRDSREMLAKPQLDAAVKDMTASGKQVAALAGTAQAALRALVVAADEHRALVHRATLLLDEQGLGPVEGEEFPTQALGKGGVVIRGEWFAPVEAELVLLWVTMRVARACLPFTLFVRYLTSTASTACAPLERSGILRSVPAVKPIPREQAPRRERVEWPETYIKFAGRSGIPEDTPRSELTVDYHPRTGLGTIRRKAGV
jgi:hypothetical protein